MIFAVYIQRDSNVETANNGVDGNPVRLNINKSHDLLGHQDEACTCAVAKNQQWTIVHRSMKPCKYCTAGKAWQKNVNKKINHVKATKQRERVFLDISTVKEKNRPKVNAKKNWHIMVDEFSSLKFTTFFPTKNAMVELTLEQFNQWQAKGIIVKFVRCDNAGENKLLEKRLQSKDWKMALDFKYTARATPQQNHLTELEFASLFNKGRTMMYHANLPQETKYKNYR
eukprot:7809157-Ditylum_brightwellii.AAC.1